MVPTNWDSWGKIRILGGLDTEIISNGWSEDIKAPLGSELLEVEELGQKKADDEEDVDARQKESAIARYEQWCRVPNTGGLAVVESAMNEGSAVGVESDNTQEFLERQLKILEAFKTKVTEISGAAVDGAKLDKARDGGISEHIGPVQFNMGGIQVDADDMLQRIKVRYKPCMVNAKPVLTINRIETHRWRARILPCPIQTQALETLPRILTTISYKISSRA